VCRSGGKHIYGPESSYTRGATQLLATGTVCSSRRLLVCSSRSSKHARRIHIHHRVEVVEPRFGSVHTSYQCTTTTTPLSCRAARDVTRRRSCGSSTFPIRQQPCASPSRVAWPAGSRQPASGGGVMPRREAGRWSRSWFEAPAWLQSCRPPVSRKNMFSPNLKTNHIYPTGSERPIRPESFNCLDFDRLTISAIVVHSWSTNLYYT
jgi:hypothetical protein